MILNRVHSAAVKQTYRKQAGRGGCIVPVALRAPMVDYIQPITEKKKQ